MSRNQILKNIKELERRLPQTMGRQRVVTKNVIKTLKTKLRERSNSKGRAKL